MQKLNECIAKLKQILPEDSVLIDEPMSKHTTFQIGGPADCFVMPSTVEEAIAVIKIVKEYDVPLTMLGNGSNLLVMDKGIRGIVVNLNERFAKITRDGNFIKAQCGALMVDVSKFAGEASLTGLEFAVGIPGSIGGCIFMNAGAYDGEIKNVVHRVSAIDKEGNLVYYTNEEAQFSYRHSIFQDNDNLILEVELELQEGNQDEILAKMADLTNRRETKQPLEYPSAGSVFKNPKGNSAGKLIDECGLKNLSIGGAKVSDKHANFIINYEFAKSSDIIKLIEEIKKEVKLKKNIDLELEQIIIKW